MPGRKHFDGDDRPLPTHHIRAWRQHRRLKIRQVAEESGLSISTISEIERHAQDFTGRTLLAIAQALGAEPGELLLRTPKKADALKTIFDELEPDDQNRVEIQVRALRDARHAR